MHNDFMLAIWIPFFWDPKFEPQLSNQNRYRLIKNMYICKLENIYIIINYVNIHMYYNNYISVYMLLYTSVIFRLHVEAPTLPVQGSRMEYRSPQGFFHFGATKKTPEDSAASSSLQNWWKINLSLVEMANFVPKGWDFWWIFFFLWIWWFRVIQLKRSAPGTPNKQFVIVNWMIQNVYMGNGDIH